MSENEAGDDNGGESSGAKTESTPSEVNSYGETRTENAETDRPTLAEQRDVDTVYQPAEDSKLLADVAVERIGDEVETEAADSQDVGLTVLDVGTGSGYVGLRVTEETGATVLGNDINPAACHQAAAGGLPVLRGHLLEPIQPGGVAVVVCNPPYLPMADEEEWGDWMDAALSGGESGRAVIEALLDELPRVLPAEGFALLVVSTLTDLAAVRAYARDAGLTVSTLREDRFPFERLVVLELSVGHPDDENDRGCRRKNNQ